jgi:surfeit locus 1 family protein
MPRASNRKRVALLALTLAFAAAFTALGIWQIERRAGKLALIAAVASRVDAPPTAPPAPAQWAGVSAAHDQYRHVTVTGRLDQGRETLVRTVTERGPGFWVMTPLVTADRGTILINRGFVPEALAHRKSRQALEGQNASITGLLRISEPGGRILRANDPTQDRWFSRDVAAISQARGLGPTAPFFIDADDKPNPGGWPLGGLTIIAFPNNHLVYAVTWFTLAALCLCGFGMVWRQD